MALILQLFQTFFLIGMFSFGGGMASMELIRDRVVFRRQWMTTEEFTDIISISEMTPGPLGINIASFVGTRVAGFSGTVAATAAYVLPAVMIVMVLAFIYQRYRKLDSVQGILKSLRPAVAAMVLAAAVKFMGNVYWGGWENIRTVDTDLVALLLSLILFGLLAKKKLGPVQTILAGGVAGAVVYGLCL